MAEAVRAVVAEIHQPTHLKRFRLSRILEGWRHMTQSTYLQRRSAVPQLHSAYARGRFKSTGKADPVYLAHYDLRVKHTENKHSKVWVRIPYRPRQPLWLPLRMNEDAEAILFSSRLRDSKLIEGCSGRFWMHFTVTRDVTPIQPRAVLAVDLGEKRLATTVLLDQNGFREPRFYGKEARGIRRHYAWLRSRLGKRKLLPVIRRVKDTERRKINTLCHQISHAIVEEAKANDAVIVVGDLKGIRERARGRRMNRLISSMPNHKLTSQVDYKAAWRGVTVIKLSERGTSKTCHRCCSKDTVRVVQSVFQCHSCGLVYNADLNGAMNIAKRAWEQCFQAGAAGSPLLTLPERNLSVNDEERSSPSNQTKR